VQAPLAIDDKLVDGWKIYPNPVKGFVNIIPAIGIISYKISLVDMAGKVMLEKDNLSGKHQIDLSELGKGAYFLNISTNNGLIKSKIVKTN